MSGTKKPRKTKFDPLFVADSPMQIAAFNCAAGAPNSDAEGGPAAWVVQPWVGRTALKADDIWGAAFVSLAKRPQLRPVLDSNAIKLVFAITDAPQNPNDINQAIGRHVDIIGTFTESRRLIDKVRWFGLCLNSTAANIARVTANEMELALEDHPEVTRDEILFLVWKENACSFGGITKLELAREVCHTLFTYERAALHYRDSYCDGDNDDLAGDEWKRKEPR